MSISTPEQVEVYDKLVSQKREFSFYSGVVSGVGANAGGAKQRDPMAFEQSFKKNSLAWLLALARVEIAATASMYGRSKAPFQDMAPENYGFSEYLAVLLDDLSAHVNALATDQDLKRVCELTVKADSNTLAYLRRLKLVTDMLNTVQTASNGEFAYRARQIKRELKKYEQDLVNKVVLATANLSSTNVSNSTRPGSAQGYRTPLGAAASCQAVANRIAESR